MYRAGNCGRNRPFIQTGNAPARVMKSLLSCGKLVFVNPAQEREELTEMSFSLSVFLSFFLPFASLDLCIR